MRRNKFKSMRKFERLEDRRMMAADIDVDNDVLTIQGTDGNDHISVLVDENDSNKLLVRVKNLTTGAVLAEDNFDREDVDQIVANGLNGNDEIILGIGVDIRSKLSGGNGNDLLAGSGGNDELIGGAGNDRYLLYAAVGTPAGSDVVVENASVDTDTLNFTLVSGGVNVNLASTSTQIVNANLSLRLSSATGIENVDGSYFNDTIRGNSRDNVLRGFVGDDLIYGYEGNDDLIGDSGKDTMYGGIGNDDLYGGGDNDYLSGEAGNDYLYGDGGLDTLDGGANNDYLDGGLDGYVDILTGGSGADTFVKAKKRALPFYDFEQKVTDYNSAVDTVITRYY